MHRKKMEKVGYSGCDSVSVGANDGKREDVKMEPVIVRPLLCQVFGGCRS